MIFNNLCLFLYIVVYKKKSGVYRCKRVIISISFLLFIFIIIVIYFGQDFCRFGVQKSGAATGRDDVLKWFIIEHPTGIKLSSFNIVRCLNVFLAK